MIHIFIFYIENNIISHRLNKSNINQPHKEVDMHRKTKIIATIGPCSSEKDILRQFEEIGVDCIRINTAHGDIRQYEKMINTLGKATRIPFLIDVKGPEMRIRTDREISVTKDEKVWFGFGTAEKPHFSYDFSNTVRRGDRVFFDNGQIGSEIVSISKKNRKICLKFLDDARIKPNKGVNIPGHRLQIPSLSKKDKQSIWLAKRKKAAYIALSFVRDAKDVKNLKNMIKGSGIGIIAKIENQQGVDNIDYIIEESDGVMIARGDLGIEIREERIPSVQKEIISKCNRRGKVAIVATQMLESMVENSTPTRAETSDVANAILDGTDCLMLSGETAAGKHPTESVRMMNKIAKEVEDKIDNNIDMESFGSKSEEITKAAHYIVHGTSCSKVVAITRSGYSASLISRYRLNKETIAVTDKEDVAKRLHLVWGVNPILTKKIPKNDMIKKVGRRLYKRDFVRKSDVVLFVAGVNTKIEKITNMVEVHPISELF